MDSPTPPRDPAEAQLALARWLSRQVAPPWSPREPDTLEHMLGSPMKLPEGVLPPRGFAGVRAPRATPAARWAGPVFGTEVSAMAWADRRMLVCGGQDGQVFALHLDERAQTWWPRLIGRQAGAITHLQVVSSIHLVAAADATGVVALWPLADVTAAAPRAELVVAGGQPVRDLAVHAGVGLVAAAAQRGGACIWPLDAQGRIEAEPKADAASVFERLVFSGDGRTLAGVTQGGELALWQDPGGSTRLGRVIRTGFAPPLLVEPWGARLWLVVLPDLVGLWSAEQGDQPERVFKDAPDSQAPIVAAVAHQDRQRVMLAFADGALGMLDPAGREIVEVGRGHRLGMLDALVFSPAGDRMVSRSQIGNLALWDTAAGEQTGPIAHFEHPSPPIRTLAISADGRWLAGAGGSDVLRLWPMTADATGAGRIALAYAWLGPRKPTRLLACGTASDQVTTASEDGSVWLWSAALPDALPLRDEVSILGPTGSGGTLGCLEASRDGRRWFVGRNDGAFLRGVVEPAAAQPIWHVATATHQHLVNRIALDEARGLVATGGVGGSVALWRTDPRVSQAPLHAWKAHDGALTKLYFMPGSQRLVSAEQGGSLRWWTVDAAGRIDGARGEAAFPNDMVSTLAAPPGGERLCVGLASGRLMQWRLGSPTGGTLEVEADAHRGEVFHLEPFGDTRCLSAGADGRVLLWNLDRARAAEPDVELQLHEGAVRHMALDPTRWFLATAGDDGRVAVCEPAAHDRTDAHAVWTLGRPVRRVLWHAARVLARFDGGWCHWRVPADDPTRWQLQALVLQLDGTTLLRLGAEGIELIRDRPIATARDAEGRLLPADPHVFGGLVFADGIDELSRPATRPRLFDAWQLAERLQWPAGEDPPRRLRVRWADEAERDRWLPREVRGPGSA